MQARKQINKTFVFQQEDTQQATFVDCLLDCSLPTVCLNDVFSEHCPFTGNKIFLYDPDSNDFVSFSQLEGSGGSVPKRILDPDFILVRFSSIVIDSNECISQQNPQMSASHSKQEKSKERTIRDVLESVKKWRDIHQHGHTTSGKRVNLQEAAKIVGVSKKSLDDYYHKLRLAELYHFEFQKHLDQKIGILRAYVKSNKRKNWKHEKLPNTLKVLNSINYKFMNKTNIKVEKISNQEVKMNDIHSEQLQLNLIGEDPPSFNSISYNNLLNNNYEVQQSFNNSELSNSQLQLSLEDEFFRKFQQNNNMEVDPYCINLIDFSQRNQAEDSSISLFFN